MSTQLIATNHRTAIVAGPESGIFQLPGNHSIVIQSTKSLNDEWGTYNPTHYLSRWAENLSKFETVLEYATSLVSFIVNNKVEDEIEDRYEVLSGCAAFLSQAKFERIFEEGSPQPGFGETELRDLVDANAVEQYLLKKEAVAKALDQVEDVVLSKLTEAALIEWNEIDDRYLGPELRELIKQRGPAMLRWYRKHFKACQDLTFVGFDSDETEPVALRVRFGGSLGGLPLVEYLKPFETRNIFDSTYENLTIAEKVYNLGYIEDDFNRRLRGFFPVTMEQIEDLQIMRLALDRIENPWLTQENHILLEITTTEVVKK